MELPTFAAIGKKIPDRYVFPGLARRLGMIDGENGVALIRVAKFPSVKFAGPCLVNAVFYPDVRGNECAGRIFPAG